MNELLNTENFERLFSNFIEPLETTFKDMRADLVEKEDKYELSVDLPGYSKKDINVEVFDGKIVISAEREEKEEKDGVLLNERKSSLKRSFSLKDISNDDVTATLREGVLYITIMKKKDSSKKIEIV